MVDASDAANAAADSIVGPAVRGYVDAGLWVALDVENGEPTEASVYASDVTADAMSTITDDVTDFVLSNSDDITFYSRAFRTVEDIGNALGHDFFLTRNGHGAGFWDRGFGEVGESLTKASKAYGEQTFMVTDNGDVKVM